MGIVRVVGAIVLLLPLLLCAAANAAGSPALVRCKISGMPEDGSGGGRQVAARLAFSAAPLTGMPAFWRRRATAGSLLQLRGAADHRSDGGHDRRRSEVSEASSRSGQGSAAGEEVGRGGKKKKQQQHQQQHRSSSPAWSPERKRPRRVQKLEVARRMPHGIDDAQSRKVWNPMGAAHGVADRGAAGGSGGYQETALLAGQIGKWQKLRGSSKEVEAKVKCGLCIVPPREAWDQIQVRTPRPSAPSPKP